MEPTSGGNQPAVHEMGNRPGGPVCHQGQQGMPTSVPPYLDPQTVGTDAPNISWGGMSNYAYPPQAILKKVLQK